MRVLLALTVAVLLSGCKSETPSDPAVPTKDAVCSSVGKTAKDADGKPLMCYREDGDLVPRWNEG